MTLNRYKSRLDRQARGAPVVAIKGVLIILSTGEDECEELMNLSDEYTEHAISAA